jgi:peptide/nickel transport system permease protein
VNDPALAPPELIGPAIPHGRRLPNLRKAIAFRRTQIGIAIVLVLAFVAIFGPFLAPKSPTGFVASPYAQPSSSATLGTDYIGRDVLSRFLWGGRSVLGLALAATALGVLSGIGIGLIAAYARSWLDNVVMRLMDVLMAFPPVIFALLVVSTVGTKIWLLIVTVAAIHMPRVARLVRGAALEVIERDFVKSAEALGESRTRILLSEILPNITSPLLVEMSLRLTFSIALVASLSFLGFGLQPPAADWGLMISENRNGLSVQPWPVVLPVAAIGLLTIGSSLIADGLSRALVGIE